VGNPRSRHSWAIRIDVSGVSRDGLRTTALPATSGAIVGVVVQQRPVPRTDDPDYAARVVNDTRALGPEEERSAPFLRDRPAAGAA
jgi:hypothetical protein